MKVIVSRHAENDMAEIATWIARDSPRAADRMIDRFVDAADALARHPLRYPAVGYQNLRKRPLGDYVILYRVDEDTVHIVRVLHSARDWLALLDET